MTDQMAARTSLAVFRRRASLAPSPPSALNAPSLSLSSCIRLSGTGPSPRTMSTFTQVRPPQISSHHPLINDVCIGTPQVSLPPHRVSRPLLTRITPSPRLLVCALSPHISQSIADLLQAFRAQSRSLMR